MPGALADASPQGALLEREEELSRLLALQAAARAGNGSFAVVEGAPGIGKSALLRELRAQAHAGGVAVTWARASPVAGDVPGALAAQLVAPFTSGSPPEPAASSEQESATAHALFWVLAEAADQAPVLVAVDDVQWADPASVRFLRFLLARVEDLPMLVVVAVRTGEPATAGTDLEALTADAAVEIVRPDLLSTSAVARLLESVLGPVDPRFAEACRRATGGNPFFTRELARTLRDRGVAPQADRVPALEEVGPGRVARWALERAGRLPRGALALARAVAVLDEAELRHAAALAGLPADIARRRAAELVRAGILDDQRSLRFVHPILRSAIYQEMPEHERADAHARAARLFLADAASPERAAAHLLRADGEGDPGAVEALAAAARRASARGAHDSAAAYLRRALAEPPPVQRRPALQVALGDLECRLGDPRGAEVRLRDALDAATTPEERAGAAIALARSVGFQGRLADAAQVLEPELARAAELPGEIALWLELDYVHYGALTEPPAAALRERLERHAGLQGRTRLERGLLVQLARERTTDRPATEWAPLAVRGLGAGKLFGEAGIDLMSWIAGVGLLIAAEERKHVERILATALTDARAHHAPYEFAGVASAAGRAALAWGNLDEAQAMAEAAMAAARGYGTDDWFTAAVRLVQVFVARGRLDDAEAVLRAAGGSAGPPPTLFGRMLTLARGELRRAQGRIDEAIRDLRVGEELAAATGTWTLTLRARGQLALALAQRDPAEAAAHADGVMDVARRWATPGATGWARHVQALVAGGGASVEMLEAAIADLERSPLRLDLAVALIDLGAALRRSGRRRAARDALMRGSDLALHCGAAGQAARAEQELRATGARPRNLFRTGVDALTPMERRIATMAAEGMSNPQIAQALFVTRKNVEMHLSRAYAKLDIRSREDLPGVLAQS